MIEVVVGELTEAESEALLRPVSHDWAPVTAAMRRLEAAAGDALLERCRRLGELPVGSATITPGGDLAADFLVHVVVRSYDEAVSAPGVAKALLNGLRRLDEWSLRTVAMPLLGTGAGNLDAEEAADAMVPVLLEHLAGRSGIERVTVVAESEYEREAFERRLRWHAREAGVAGNGAAEEAPEGHGHEHGQVG